MLRLVHVMDELGWVNGFESAKAFFDDVLPRGLARALAANVEAESELVIQPAGRVADEAKRSGAD